MIKWTTINEGICAGQSGDHPSPAVPQMLVPLEQYLACPESDQDMLKAYGAALRRGAVTAARNPALHAVASARVG